MIVEIRGVSFRGLGAELMISSIQEHVLSRAPNAEFALMPIGSYQERRKRNFLTKLPPFRLGRASLSAALMSSAFRKTLGVVANEDIDVILDASGFAYSDQWGAYGATELLRLCNWRRRQKPKQKIVLLPQAFGPSANQKQEASLHKLSMEWIIFLRETKSRWSIFSNLAHLSLAALPLPLISPEVFMIMRSTVPWIRLTPLHASHPMYECWINFLPRTVRLIFGF